MSNPTPIATLMQQYPPRTVEGDQGRVTTHSLSDVIKADEYNRKAKAMATRKTMANTLRHISGLRLVSHNGPAT